MFVVVECTCSFPSKAFPVADYDLNTATHGELADVSRKLTETAEVSIACERVKTHILKKTACKQTTLVKRFATYKVVVKFLIHSCLVSERDIKCVHIFIASVENT